MRNLASLRVDAQSQAPVYRTRHVVKVQSYVETQLSFRVLRHVSRWKNGVYRPGMARLVGCIVPPLPGHPTPCLPGRFFGSRSGATCTEHSPIRVPFSNKVRMGEV
ncbi:hypothetical protein RRG08_063623 [Elysia crispata]|uniref:Uncharacterized protein n=1 Tax=Elysia crispata TaxID=231223 RepID=A0AAE1AI81_9GAST|nr:hypothetical protein RRG08_063623 [Elysia crispata]